MADFKLPAWSTRNPLGIIALFISLIYGMSAFLLGASVKNLSQENQNWLVYFIVTFPFVVLFVFGWLVSAHHTKLYGPADYRSDKGFLDAGRSVPTMEVGKRIAQELAENSLIEVPPKRSSASSSDAPIARSESGAIVEQATSRSYELSRIYLAEGLVFQALQAEFEGTIRKDVKIAGRHVDGIIYSPNGTVTIVEVKIISVKSPNWHNRVRDGERYMTQFRSALQNADTKNVQLLLALVVDGNVGRVAEVRSGLPGSTELDVRIFSLYELMSRYGFSDPDSSQP
jgi:hypothetical protein